MVRSVCVSAAFVFAQSPQAFHPALCVVRCIVLLWCYHVCALPLLGWRAVLFGHCLSQATYVRNWQQTGRPCACQLRHHKHTNGRGNGHEHNHARDHAPKHGNGRRHGGPWARPRARQRYNRDARPCVAKSEASYAALGKTMIMTARMIRT